MPSTRKSRSAAPPVPTSLNVWVLKKLFGLSKRIPNAVDACSAPHIRRCMRAADPLCVSEGPKGARELVLTPAGVAAIAKVK